MGQMVQPPLGIYACFSSVGLIYAPATQAGFDQMPRASCPPLWLSAEGVQTAGQEHTAARRAWNPPIPFIHLAV